MSGCWRQPFELALLNSSQSVTNSGACDELNLLINARMGVGHAGVAIKRSSCRQKARCGGLFGLRRVFPKNTSSSRLAAKRCWWRPGALLNFLYHERPTGRSRPGTPTRHRRTTTVIRGSGILVVRFMFWKEDTQARTPVPSPETRRSRPAHSDVRLNRAFHTTERTVYAYTGTVLDVRTSDRAPPS